MESDPLVYKLLLQVFLISINALFACAEIAVITMNDNKLAKLTAEGNVKAARLSKLTSQPARFLATIQVGITFAGFLGSAFAADNFADKLVFLVQNLNIGVDVNTLKTIAVILITLILSYFTLVFGELVPKRVAMRNAEKLALSMSGFIYVISVIFKPIVGLLTISTNGILRLIGIDPNAEDDVVTEEEIRMLIDAGSEKGAIDVEEKELLQKVFEFDDRSAEETMTHRTDTDILWMEDSDEDWEKLINDTRHSIYPVCDNSVDNIIGVLDVKDYFRLTDRTRANVMSVAIKPAYFVFESVKLDDLFRNMKNSRKHFAIVIDEYGGMSGIITMNDLLEQLVGDFDEIDDEELEPYLKQISDNRWRVNGLVTVKDIIEQLKVKLPEDGEYDTFGGLVFDVLKAIPEDGSQLELKIGKMDIAIKKIKDHRIMDAYITVNKEIDSDEND